MESLTIQLSDAQDELKTLKRRHAANVKDLSRQLQQSRKRLEQMDNKSDRDTASMGSRTSSVNSLDTPSIQVREDLTPQVHGGMVGRHYWYTIKGVGWSFG